MKKTLASSYGRQKSQTSGIGKTALVLSGGGSRGAYQCGAWRAIIELGIPIDIVVGVSVGALNSAMVVQGDPFLTSGLWRKLVTDKVFDVKPNAQITDFASEFFRQGGADVSGLKEIIDNYLDEDLIRKSPMDFGLLTVELPLMKPHYLWKDEIPEGKMGDYIIASSSAFPALKPHTIDGKSYIDGGYENNMPIHMAVERGATNIIAIYLDAVGRYDKDKEMGSSDNIKLISPKLDLGSFLVFDPNNSEKIMRLGYLDAMKVFDIYDGNLYSFAKKEFDKKTLKKIDDLASLFELDPLILYTRKSFISRLVDIIIEHNKRSDALKEQDLSPSSIKTYLNHLNKKTAVILIAKNIKENGEASIFNKSYIKKLIPAEINAAKVLLSFELL
ncbi:Patatin [[Eubacterium] infirmum]|nr:Patatin [[Eubacterium] infirmum]